MLEVFALLFFVSVLGTVCEKCKIINKDNKLIWSKTSNLFFIVICIILILFAGLRTVMNDTGTYIFTFNNWGDINNKVDWTIGANPFFALYQILLHNLNFNGYWFIFVTSFFVELSYLLFTRKYADNFAFSLFLFLAFTVYAFTMAAMKQTISVAIGIWAIPLFFKKKYIFSLLLIGIAVLFHPYIFLYISLFFLSDNIFDRKIYLIIFISLIVGYSLSSLVGAVSEITATVTGDTYSAEELSGSGVNIFRFLFYLIVPVFSYIHKDKIKETKNKFLFLFINFSIIAACFSFVSLFGSTVLIGRLPAYFDVFICLVLPYIINIGIKDIKNKKLIIFILCILYIGFYYIYYSKYSYYMGDSCFYNHITLLDLLGVHL